MSDKGMHVLSLQPRQQAALSLLMYNAMQAYLHKAFEDIKQSIELPDEFPQKNVVQVKKAASTKAFDAFYRIHSFLAFPSQASKAEPKMIMIGASNMAYIRYAADAYQSNNNVLDQSERKLIESELDGLRILITESSQHTFTKDDLKKHGVL